MILLWDMLLKPTVNSPLWLVLCIPTRVYYRTTACPLLVTLFHALYYNICVGKGRAYIINFTELTFYLLEVFPSVTCGL